MTDALQSAVYEGVVRHRRTAPRQHELSMPLFMMYLDLAELEVVFKRRWLWSTRHANVAWMRRADYLGDASISLDEAVRQRVEQELGWRPAGPIRVLTHLRYFGYAFNPVTFYYCFDDAGSQVQAVVAEITNTPWKERHAYVLDARERGLNAKDPFEFGKVFHVSPFMRMEQRYRWRFTPPGNELVVQMDNLEAPHDEQEKPGAGTPAKLFDATLTLRRREISGPALARVLVIYPLLTVQVIAAIYFHALLLRLKGVAYVPHPDMPAARLQKDHP